MKYLLQQGEIEVDTIVFDLNGTLAEYGGINPETYRWITQLKQLEFHLIILTSDQRGNAEKIAGELQIDYHIAKTGDEKRNFVKRLGKPFFAIGNARNDIPMFREATISFVTLQSEGIHSGILPYADILVTSIADAFRLIIDGDGFISTMKV